MLNNEAGKCSTMRLENECFQLILFAELVGSYYVYIVQYSLRCKKMLKISFFILHSNESEWFVFFSKLRTLCILELKKDIF